MERQKNRVNASDFFKVLLLCPISAFLVGISDSGLLLVQVWPVQVHVGQVFVSMAKGLGWYLGGPCGDGLSALFLYSLSWDGAQRHSSALLFRWTENPSLRLKLDPGRFV